MRDIKFRAWDKKKKYMYEKVISLDLHIGGWILAGGKDLETTGEIPVKNVTLMQYTGLKDKNGKEIYEGDIVMRNKYTKESGQIGMMGPYEIYWNEERAGFEYRTDGYQAGLFYDEHEVIGNIHENPELLEVTR